MKWAITVVLILAVVLGGLVWWQSNEISKLEVKRQELIRENSLLEDQAAIAEQDRALIESMSRAEILSLRSDIETLERSASEHIDRADEIRTEIVTRYRDVEVPVEVPVEYVPPECELFAEEAKELRFAVADLQAGIKLEKKVSENLEEIVRAYESELLTKNSYIDSLKERIEVTDKQLRSYQLKDKFNLFRPKLVVGAGLAAGYREVQPAVFIGIGWSF